MTYKVRVDHAREGDWYIGNGLDIGKATETVTKCFSNGYVVRAAGETTLVYYPMAEIKKILIEEEPAKN